MQNAEAFRLYFRANYRVDLGYWTKRQDKLYEILKPFVCWTEGMNNHHCVWQRWISTKLSESSGSMH